MKPSLCLNMIVRNESARIERCLATILPHVKAVCVLDTGSTDDTPALIAAMCKAAKVPLHLGHGEFRDFSQARNEAFGLCQRRVGRDLPFCQFVLLCDADMVLVVDEPRPFSKLDARDASYDMMQKAGTMSYANRRLINIGCKKLPYVGVTHEYVDVPTSGTLTGAYFLDFADGSNRDGKFERDAKLLEDALAADPNNGRYWYYLGNTYRDGNQHADALLAYRTKFELGGWDEEQHSTLMNIADCHKKMGNDAGFVDHMLRAYSYRPQRVEPLYELARHYREKGDNAAALLFAERGLSIPRPNDQLFVNDFAYSHGCRYECSIAGYYDQSFRPRAFALTNALALDPTFDQNARWSARQNLYWHTQPLAAVAPSFGAKRLDFEAPDGYVAMNPSVTALGDHIYCNVRCVNYRIDEHGRYLIRGTDGESNGTNPIDTRNFILKLDEYLDEVTCRELTWERPSPKYDMVVGLEDVRLWHDDSGNLSFNACAREQSSSGTPQQMIGKVQFVDNKTMAAIDVMPISPEHECEKNWMHLEGLKFVYRLDKTATVEGPQKSVIKKLPCAIECGDIAGSSQCIRHDDGHLCVVHEAYYAPDGQRAYWHRFAWLNRFNELKKISKPFVFFDRQIEFCAGLARLDTEFLISFGVRDAEAWIARVKVEEVSALLEDIT